MPNPLIPEQIADIEACGNVEVSCLSEAAARHLRGRATADDDVVACVAEIDEKMGQAEVYLASFWDMVPGSNYFAETRFPPSLNWVCINQAGAAQIGEMESEMVLTPSRSLPLSPRPRAHAVHIIML